MRTDLVIRAGFCPTEIPFAGEEFDLICLFDVLEHIEADMETLVALKSLLAAAGRVLITVPAYQWLWSKHDEFLHYNGATARPTCDGRSPAPACA